MINIVIGLSVLSCILGYVVWNLYRKIQVYEQSIEQFYSALTVTLANMRILDAKQMFETDDEVGEIFQQLVDITANLRPILYGMETNEDKEN